MRDTEVLIAGAGPTGLVLALWLTRLGARVRIVDKRAEVEATSRAIGVQARTLELYRQFGLADTVVEQGRKAPAANLWVSGRNKARFSFGDMGADLSPFPYALVLSQDEHERRAAISLGGSFLIRNEPLKRGTVPIRSGQAPPQSGQPMIFRDSVLRRFSSFSAGLRVERWRVGGLAAHAGEFRDTCFPGCRRHSERHRTSAARLAGVLRQPRPQGSSKARRAAFPAFDIGSV